MTKKRRTRSKSGRVTLHDVITHVGHVGQRVQRVEDEMRQMEKRLSARIDSNTEAIKAAEENLTRCIDALDEGLTATIIDTITIRKHIGMSVPEDA